MLQRLGSRFREQGLCRPKPGAQIGDIINALGRRLGDDPSPDPPSVQLAAARRHRIEEEEDSSAATAAADSGLPAAAASSQDCPFRVGDTVVLHGLSKAALNGQEGVVVRPQPGGPAPREGRLPVRLAGSGEGVLVKAVNLMAAGSAAATCSQAKALTGDSDAAAKEVAARPATLGSAASSHAEATEGPSGQAGEEEPKRGEASAWHCSQDKMAAGREKEQQIKDRLWQQFLPGDDLPVGDDGLPPPAAFFSGFGPRTEH